MNEEKTQIADGVASELNAELGLKLWAINIPTEPDSEMFHPVPSLEIGESLALKLKDEAVKKYKIVGDIIADSIYVEEWKGSKDEHDEFLKKHKEWWNYCTFLD